MTTEKNDIVFKITSGILGIIGALIYFLSLFFDYVDIDLIQQGNAYTFQCSGIDHLFFRDFVHNNISFDISLEEGFIDIVSGILGAGILITCSIILLFSPHVNRSVASWITTSSVLIIASCILYTEVTPGDFFNAVTEALAHLNITGADIVPRTGLGVIIGLVGGMIGFVGGIVSIIGTKKRNT